MSEFNDSIYSHLAAILGIQDLVSVEWAINDIKELRPDLTDVQVFLVYLEYQRREQCEFEFPWEVLPSAIEQLFPTPCPNGRDA